MDSERILRTAVFGGFKREDVLQYVEDLKGQIVQLTEQVKGKSVQLKALQEMVDTLSAECEKAQETETKLTETVTALETAHAENARLQAENGELCARLSAASEERKALDKRAQEIRSSEAQLGLAFLDARKYSDEIVTAANKRAGETQTEASDSIAKQANEVARLSDDVDALAATLAKSIDELHADIAALSAKLSRAAQSLANRKEAERFLPDISIKIEDIPSIQVQDAAKPDDGGLTLLKSSQNGTQASETKPAYRRIDTSVEG